MKVCSKCEQEKEADAFNTSKVSKDGLHSYCKECLRAYQRERRKALKEIRDFFSQI